MSSPTTAATPAQATSTLPTLAVMFGVILLATGIVAYVHPAPLGLGKDHLPATGGHPSSLSPAVVGAILLLAGIISMVKPEARKHAMHAAAGISLLGSIGGLVPVFLRHFDFREVAVKVGVIMAVSSVIFLTLCVNSFIQARKARQAAAATAA